jgi:hypothetical protein
MWYKNKIGGSVMKPNQEIRKKIRDSQFCSWQVAEQMQMAENTFYRLLRKPLSNADKQRIVDALDQLKEKHFKNKAI